MLAGLNEAVTPEGRPVAVSATALENPPVPAMLIVAVAARLRGTLRPVAVEVSLKLAGALATVSATVVFAVTLPMVPVTVTVALLAAADEPAVSVNRADVAVVLVSKDAVTPVGSPLTVNAAAPVNPLVGLTAMTLVPDVPGLMPRLAGVAPKVNPGVPLTVKAIVVIAVTAPEVPVNVTVAVATGAVNAAVKVTVLPLAVAVPKAAVTPVGNPLAVIVGVPVNPFTAVTAIVLAADAPSTTLTLCRRSSHEAKAWEHPSPIKLERN